MSSKKIMHPQGAIARVPASDQYFVASGDQSGVAPGWFAGGEQLQVTRREAGDCSILITSNFRFKYKTQP